MIFLGFLLNLCEQDKLPPIVPRAFGSNTALLSWDAYERTRDVEMFFYISV
jgi:hypothetical protein